ncbi:LOW QUALITY PROTEIN: TRAF3-interacting protein 1-like [Asparagus officinalis]|uniref:LOW QUALITY PROTEIN: TRAF3-interacting protein 1-like n=1 Tax=Asparagus officinalis TaxID=4686 RepID=UPI00098E2008|nr:LOW QUALITY PROTEIN: TRAF3-interacting protein 1-like [Asparagus officinalis]
MSRCFPFPPPGYEKKPRSSEQGDILAKEKHREKKHKKEKKDKEKREGKERKDKDRSRDKHKEKRDKKEKHKDKKKDKDKNKTSEVRRKTEHLSEARHEDILGFDKQKAEEINDSKFKEEFGRRIRDDEQEAANLMVKDLSSTTHKRVENISCSTGTGKENSTGNKVVADVTGTVQRRNEKLTPPFKKQTEGFGIAVNSQKQKVPNSEKALQFNSSEQGRKEILTPQMQKRIESMGTATTMEKQRAASNEKIGAFTSAEQKRNHATGHPMDKVPILYEELRAYSLSIQCAKGKSGPVINMVSNSIRSTTKRNDGIEQSTRSLTSSVPRKFEDMGAAPATEKERSSFPNITRTEQRTEGLPMGKSTEKKAEGMEKTKEKKSEDEKKEGHKKRKEKDKDRHKEKKKEEKKREKEDKHKKHDKLKESEIKDQIGSLNNKTLGPRVETINTITADGINKKRKEFERNGFLHEPQIDGRPNKLQRTSASSNSTVENGRPLELIPNTKLEAINHFKNERGLDNNGNHLNGKVKIQPSDVCRPPIVPPPITVDSSKKDQIPSIKPHPDTKYLSTIYSVPKMVELMESDEQDWLFSSESPRSSTKLKADGATPQVWAKGQQIEAADIFALPYVIPY